MADHVLHDLVLHQSLNEIGAVVPGQVDLVRQQFAYQGGQSAVRTEVANGIGEGQHNRTGEPVLELPLEGEQ